MALAPPANTTLCEPDFMDCGVVRLDSSNVTCDAVLGQLTAVLRGEVLRDLLQQASHLIRLLHPKLLERLTATSAGMGPYRLPCEVAVLRRG